MNMHSKGYEEAKRKLESGSGETKYGIQKMEANIRVMYIPKAMCAEKC